MNTPDSTFSDDFVYIYDMMGFGHGKRTGRSMKHRKFIFVCFAAFVYLVFCGHACSPADPSKIECGLSLDIYTPQEADSIHVAIYRNDTLLYLLKDTIPCKACDRQVNLEKTCRDLIRETGQDYGRFYIEEKAFCRKLETLFMVIPVTIEHGHGAYINAHDIPEYNELYSTFATQKNDCNIDSSYKLIVVDNAE